MKNKKLALETIQNAPTIGRVIALGKRGEPICAIGWLFCAAKPLLPDNFEPAKRYQGEEIFFEELPYRTIEAFFGLSSDEVSDLWAINDDRDNVDNPGDRRRAVLSFLSSLPED